MKTRTEHDPLGKKKVPSTALYGIHTQRAKENFHISHSPLPLPIFHAIAQIKIAAAYANTELGFLQKKKANAIVKAAKEVIQGKHDAHMVIDAFQAGAGTPTHMNVNEIIANRANELLGHKRGQYKYVHPNDHVNMGQSTNNVVPSALKMVVVKQLATLLPVLHELEQALKKKSIQFKTIHKSGRTHLQDAVPITLGQEFHAYAIAVQKNRQRIKTKIEELLTLNVGKNAIGTGINTHPSFTSRMVKHLKKQTKYPWKVSEHPIYATQFSTAFLDISQTVTLLAVDVNKIVNDLRLLSSGPHTGFNEIILPAVEPGSSIMPGKINPSIGEMLNMVCYQVMGNNHTIEHAANASQLELNVMTPVIAKNLIESLTILTNGTTTFTKRCVQGIKANKAQCQWYVENSAGLATILNPVIGYDKAAEVVKESLQTKKSIKSVVIKRKIMSGKAFDKLVHSSTTPNKKR
jgi:aspartate ammonia-lyase